MMTLCTFDMDEIPYISIRWASPFEHSHGSVWHQRISPVGDVELFIDLSRLKSQREKTMEHKRKPMDTGKGASAEVDRKYVTTRIPAP
jgi:hypothetical protein